MSDERARLQCECGGAFFAAAFTYDRPPDGEVRFQATASAYRREFLHCSLCGHFSGSHDLDLDGLYTGDYVESTYGNGLRAAYERVLALPPSRSDNNGRVERVLAFAASRWAERRSRPSILDVGAGLCVFLARMRDAGWTCTALDPDERAVEHARTVVGIGAVHADFLTKTGVGVFDVVTFNKVLEHVLNPVTMLARAAECLKPGGFVYLEVPDGEAAAAEGQGREEFFVDHWHAFSPASVALLVRNAGLSMIAVERLREPSTKFTLRAFAELPGADHPRAEGERTEP